jgi:hypothetical protein
MALATSTILLGAVAAATALGGVQGKREADKQARLAEQQAADTAAETRRITARESELEQRDIDKTADRQKLAFLKSGVSLEGSPLLKLEETRRLGAENIEEIEKSGEAQANAQITEGRVAANQLKASGRQSLISGITGGARTAAGAF